VTDYGYQTNSLVLVPIGAVLPVGQICKPLFPQELQSPQGFFARFRMRFPKCNTRHFFGIHPLVVFVQYYFHPSYVFISECKINQNFPISKRKGQNNA
jgi:hypothetical protein